MTAELVTFPKAGDIWKDTGEGGMYVYAVVPRKPSHVDYCAVENSIVLTAPDFPVSDIRDLWGDSVSAAQEERIRDDAARLLDREGFAAKAATVRSFLTLDSLSTDMLAAVFMGSTSRSLMAVEHEGVYWEADQGDLTPNGILLMDQLSVAFDQTPQLLTFLDT